jgi:hypothetical protein
MAGLTACVLFLALTGCRVNVTPPKPASVREIKVRTIARIDRFEKAMAEGRLHAEDVKLLAVSINWLRGHMRSTEVGTEEQLRALDEILYQLARAGGAGMTAPPDWRPSDVDNAPVPEPIIVPGPLKDLLPQIRKIVESVPDSDLRPDFPAPDNAL